MAISTEDPFRHVGTHIQILENADNHIFPVEETSSCGGGNADKNDTANNDAHDLPQIYKNVLTKISLPTTIYKNVIGEMQDLILLLHLQAKLLTSYQVTYFQRLSPDPLDDLSENWIQGLCYT